MNLSLKQIFILPVMFICSTALYATQEKITATVEQSSKEAEQLQAEPPMPLVSAAVRYGMFSNAYLSSPSGMVTEGYRYQLRGQYVAYLRTMLEDAPGNTIEKINDTLINDWMQRLGREEITPEVLLNLKQGITATLEEWSHKTLSGQITPYTESQNIMKELEKQITVCQRMTIQPSSDPEKRRYCHQSEQLTRDESSHLIDPNLLKSAMLKLIPMYAQSLIGVSSRPYYRAYLSSQEDFEGTLKGLLKEGYSARQLAEILEFAGIDYPEVFDQLYYFALRNDQSIHDKSVVSN